MTSDCDMDSPVFLSRQDWLEIYTALDLLIVDICQRYQGDLDESLEAYIAMIRDLMRRIGPGGEDAATRGTRWVW